VITQGKVPNLASIQQNTSNSVIQAKIIKAVSSKGETKVRRNQLGHLLMESFDVFF